MVNIHVVPFKLFFFFSARALNEMKLNTKIRKLCMNPVSVVKL